MISYKKFLSKNLTYSLIQEAFIEGSSEFFERLKSIKKTKGSAAKISDYILDFIKSDCDLYDIRQNYFDITDKNDTVSFINQSRVDKKMDNEDSTIYSPYLDKGRNEAKIGRIIKSIIELINNSGDVDKPVKFSDKDIESFVDMYKSLKFESGMEFELVKGNEIKKCYNSNRYHNDNGSMGGSCMNDEKDYFKIYTDNKNCELLVFKDKKGTLYGRALVWKLSKSPCAAKIFMDRVYTNRESDKYKFIEYAKEKGWMYKTMMNSHIDTNVNFMYNGQEYNGEISVEVDADIDDKFPFLDTLCFLNSDADILSNIPKINCYYLHSVMGECQYCGSCGGDVINKSGSIYGEYCFNCGEGLEALTKLGIKFKLK